MTSYCQNRVIIEGSAAEIRGFAHDCLSLRDELYVLDFQKILPMPSIVEGLYRSIPSKLGGKYPDEFSSGWVGMEALLRKPPPSYEGEVARPDSVLTRDVVKKVGIRNYDDLNRWLNQNDPASLDLGRKCLAAFEACGNFFEDDWVGDKWGCDPERVDYSKATMSETRYEAEFESPYGAPEGICREIVRRHPGLKSRFVALETGNDYAFVLTAKDGHTREERPEITDTLIDEVEGQPKGRLVQLDDGDLPAGSVSVDVAFSSLNYKDALAITGAGRFLPARGSASVRRAARRGCESAPARGTRGGSGGV